jgi:putative cell wall-binding protein
VRRTAQSATGSAGEYDRYRLAGPDRYSTAVTASRALYTDEVVAANPVGVVLVASGEHFADALSATALVSPAGPLLLVPPTGTVPSVVLAEIRRLSPEVVVVIGGTGAVSVGVERQLRNLAPTDRVAGSDRYDTAAQVAVIADGLYRDQSPDTEPANGVYTIYVVGGRTFPDALAAGSATGPHRGALLLTLKDTLPAVSAQAVTTVAPQRIVVVGGAGVVSDGVLDRLRQLAPRAEVVRSWGADRYKTAVAVSRSEFVHPGSGIMLASGTRYPDAIAAAAFGAVVEYALLLARPTCAPAPTVVEAADYAGYVARLEVVGVGGTGVLSDAALALKPC